MEGQNNVNNANYVDVDDVDAASVTVAFAIPNVVAIAYVVVVAPLLLFSRRVAAPYINRWIEREYNADVMLFLLNVVISCCCRFCVARRELPLRLQEALAITIERIIVLISTPNPGFFRTNPVQSRKHRTSFCPRLPPATQFPERQVIRHGGRYPLALPLCRVSPAGNNGRATTGTCCLPSTSRRALPEFSL